MTDYEPPLSREERQELMDLYQDLRTADVSDGLDFHGFGYDLNRMDREIGPLYRDMESFSHRIVGFAHTMRYLPTNRRRDLPDELGFDNVTEWRDEWYDELSDAPTDIKENDVIVLDAHDIDVGIVGSANALEWVAKGANGVITDSGPRDTDELIKEDVPVYSRGVNKPIIPGRTELDDEQVPINVGGCQVRPDDLIVADGDGVVTVPLEVAKQVGEAARAEQEDDQGTRARLYEQVGLDPDFTLEKPGR